MNEKPILDEKFAKWRGLDRTTIEWYPVIDEDKCIGCGICATGCGRDVFGFDFEKNKATVLKPFQCMVGCTTCAVSCPTDAITFPDKGYVKRLIKDNGLIAKAKLMVTEKFKK